MTAHVIKTLPSPWKWVPPAACNYRSNLGSVHQVPITAEWTETVWNITFAQHFYTWPALGIKPQTFRSWVQCPIRLATCSLKWPSTCIMIGVFALYYLWAQEKLHVSCLVYDPKTKLYISSTKLYFWCDSTILSSFDIYIVDSQCRLLSC